MSSTSRPRYRIVACYVLFFILFQTRKSSCEYSCCPAASVPFVVLIFVAVFPIMLNVYQVAQFNTDGLKTFHEKGVQPGTEVTIPTDVNYCSSR
uniref:Secreted protein n=1 Tax=Ixodes ricinus TaxID=34613 RepID=A0A6B0U928_IXORI